MFFIVNSTIKIDGRKRHPVDRLRVRVWFELAVIQSGGITPYGFWKTIDKKASSRSSWTKIRSTGQLPNDLDGRGKIHKVEEKYPGSSKIFNALFWLPLKGTQLKQEKIIEELDSFRDEFSYAPKPMLTIDYWRTELDRNNSSPGKLFRDFIGVYDCEDITLQALILMLAWADNLNHHDAWNFTCEAYRELLPAIIIGIDWPFKNEIFDAVDLYAQRRTFVNEVDRSNPPPELWRDELPRLQLFLRSHDTKLFKA